MDNKDFEVIIVGGSYAGLSAAMALGRSLRKVLIIDSGKRCNRQTPHAHNFITHDGATPGAIRQMALEQVLRYDTVTFYEGLAIAAEKTSHGFAITTGAGDVFHAAKLLFATGVKDEMPAIKGFGACWGISVLHCPYCHGYEVKGAALGLIGNGDMGFEFCKMISHWSKDLTLFTNGQSTLTAEQTAKIKAHNIPVVEEEIAELVHKDGYLQSVLFKNGERHSLTAIFAKAAFRQHCTLPEMLGCELTEQGFIKTDDLQKTTVPGIYAAGDNTSMFRALSIATGAGTKAGAMINKELIDEAF